MGSCLFDAGNDITTVFREYFLGGPSSKTISVNFLNKERMFTLMRMFWSAYVVSINERRCVVRLKTAVIMIEYYSWVISTSLVWAGLAACKGLEQGGIC